ARAGPPTRMMYAAPDPLTRAAVGPAVPPRTTPAGPNPVTGSVNVTVNRIDPSAVGSGWSAARTTATPGGTLSNATGGTPGAAELGLPAASVAAPSPIPTTTTPVPDSPVTNTVYAAP